MKDYTFEIMDKEKRKEEQDKFILRYEIKNEKFKSNNNKKKIVIYMANGKKITCDYTKELEGSILNLMKKSALSYEKIFAKARNRKEERDAFIASINVGVVSIVSLLFFILSSCGAITTPIIVILLMLSATIILTSSLYKTSCDSKFKDFEKTMLFLENEERINKYILNNSKMLEKRNSVSSNNDNKKGYTINSIDEISLKELKSIFSLIEQEESNLDNGKQKVLKK